jgi:hypothetical protein
MSDNYVFILCSQHKLKIFEIKSGNFVKQINISADQLKLAPADHLVLFDSVNRQVHLYEQFGKFRKLDKIDLAQSLGNGFMINRDKSKTLAFNNMKQIKYTTFD